MLDQFNAWITSNGHNPLPKETFASRFAGHEWVTRYGVESRRTAKLSGLVPWPVPGGFSPQNGAPKQAFVWMGVRPRTSAEQLKQDELAEVADLSTNLSKSTHMGGFVERSATSASDLETTSSEAPSGSSGASPSGSAQRDDTLATPLGTPHPSSGRETLSLWLLSVMKLLTPHNPEKPHPNPPRSQKNPGLQNPRSGSVPTRNWRASGTNCPSRSTARVTSCPARSSRRWRSRPAPS